MPRSPERYPGSVFFSAHHYKRAPFNPAIVKFHDWLRNPHLQTQFVAVQLDHPALEIS